jgi:hypothetical protein
MKYLTKDRNFYITNENIIGNSILFATAQVFMEIHTQFSSFSFVFPSCVNSVKRFCHFREYTTCIFWV